MSIEHITDINATCPFCGKPLTVYLPKVKKSDSGFGFCIKQRCIADCGFCGFTLASGRCRSFTSKEIAEETRNLHVCLLISILEQFGANPKLVFWEGRDDS